MKTKKVEVDEIKIDPNNPRFIKDARFRRLVESLRTFPKMLKYRPVIVDKNLKILGGEKRFLALKELGYKRIDVVLADDLTAREKKLFMLKDNHHEGEDDLEKLATWDADLLEEIGFEDLAVIKDQDVKVKGSRQVTFRFSERDYLKVMSAISDQMEATQSESREKFLKQLLGIK